MKTKLLLISLFSLGIATMQAQSGTTVYAKNSDISDNLDLRAVASMFGESANLQDFERRLNDPKYQISNLDLNNDDQVDYLRVIESVEDRTHVVIIQAVLDRDVYQDVATIDVERDNYNNVNVQVVGNSYLYGANYIYEPVYNVAPVIYASLWVTNYRPYCSSWTWNYYPTYYAAWRPYPVFRYRNNINVCININNRYNYVNTRRSYRAPAMYETRRTYGYERISPNNGFAQRHSNINNRYDLDQRRVASRDMSRNSYNTNNYNNNSYNTNRSNAGRVYPSAGENRTPSRNYSDNRTSSDRSYNTNRTTYNNNNNNTVRTNNPVRVENTQRSEPRSYNNNNMNTSRGNSDNRMSSNTTAPTQRSEAPRNYSENRSNAQNNSNAARQQNTQRSEAPRVSQESRGGQSQRESGSNSRGGGRRS